MGLHDIHNIVTRMSPGQTLVLQIDDDMVLRVTPCLDALSTSFAVADAGLVP
jgi:hypothetical protein